MSMCVPLEPHKREAFSCKVVGGKSGQLRVCDGGVQGAATCGCCSESTKLCCAQSDIIMLVLATLYNHDNLMLGLQQE
jgi:hypothetical protein